MQCKRFYFPLNSSCFKNKKKQTKKNKTQPDCWKLNSNNKFYKLLFESQLKFSILKYIRAPQNHCAPLEEKKRK